MYSSKELPGLEACLQHHISHCVVQLRLVLQLSRVIEVSRENPIVSDVLQSLQLTLPSAVLGHPSMTSFVEITRGRSKGAVHRLVLS